MNILYYQLLPVDCLFLLSYLALASALLNSRPSPAIQRSNLASCLSSLDISSHFFPISNLHTIVLPDSQPPWRPDHRRPPLSPVTSQRSKRHCEMSKEPANVIICIFEPKHKGFYHFLSTNHKAHDIPKTFNSMRFQNNNVVWIPVMLRYLFESYFIKSWLRH